MNKEPRLHQVGSTYYFRAKIPAELRAYFGKREIKHSLKTKDYSFARRLVRQHSVRVDDEFSALRVSLGIKGSDRLPLDEKMIQSICDSWAHNTLAGDDKTRTEGFSEDELEQAEAERLEIHGDLRKAVVRGRTELIQPILDTFLHLMKIELVGSSEDREKLASTFLKTVAKTHGLQVQRDQGETVATPAAVAHPREQEARKLMLDDLFEAWKRNYSGNSQKTIDSMASEVCSFHEVLGIKPADQYLKADLLKYRDYLLFEKELDGKTVEKRIGFIRAIYQVAVDDERLQVNPATRIKIKKSRKKSRLPFTIAELKQLIS